MTEKKKTTFQNSILKFLLENGLVNETDIRNHLSGECEPIDQGTLNRYLHNLKKIGCIELISPEKKGLGNKWDILTSKNLANIRSNYPDISLNEYEKSLMIILKECGKNIRSWGGLEFYIRLLLSVSFFNECVSTGIETLLSRAWEIYLNNDGFEKNWHISNLFNEFNTLYLNGKPDFREEKFTTNVENTSLETFLKKFDEKFPGIVKEIPTINFLEIENELLMRLKDLGLKYIIMDELFLKHIKEVIPELPTEKKTYIDSILKKIDNLYLATSDFSYEAFGEIIEEWVHGLFKGVSPLVSYQIERELILRTFDIPEEIHRKKLYHIISEKKFLMWAKDKEVSVETFREMMGKDLEIYEKLAGIYSEMKSQQDNFRHSRFDLLFEHYFDNDLLTGRATDDEIELVRTIKENFQKCCDLNKYSNGEGSFELFMYGNLEKESEIIVKYKQPSFLYRPTYEETYVLLKEHVWKSRVFLHNPPKRYIKEQ
jgi:hypothetical protein